MLRPSFAELLFTCSPVRLFGYWLLAIGYWLLAIGFWLLAFGFRLSAFGFWLLAFGFWLSACGMWHVAAVYASAVNSTSTEILISSPTTNPPASSA
jgi:hypothetical protein